MGARTTSILVQESLMLENARPSTNPCDSRTRADYTKGANPEAGFGEGFGHGESGGLNLRPDRGESPQDVKFYRPAHDTYHAGSPIPRLGQLSHRQATRNDSKLSSSDTAQVLSSEPTHRDTAAPYAIET
ncbi:hypothetical protein S40285_10125 [Stachybotrys chlorohalonatus IBT 40285]|uniref:Uncharacterized protein n=1 Tax=Stachybotrys chlorohalonatus (strain IBT 40285) TaxID=1283841 RepID=A0A084QBU3_STAC4|nr:hypothetical protein S40285_10125 [Stachybotrys chlorohalonata IBT 40285]